MATDISRAGWQADERSRPAARPRGRRWSFLPYFFILPTFILIAVIVVYPLTQAVSLSQTNLEFIRPLATHVGLRNYSTILRSATFQKVLVNSFVWTVSVVAFQFLLGLGTALLLNQPFRGRMLARSLMIIPWVTPGVIAGLLWRLMYEPNLGIINGALAALGFPHPIVPWLSQGSTAMLAVIITAIWKGTPFSTVMYLAALQGVSEELLDAAKIDGATGWNRLRYIVIPEIMPVIRVTVLLTTVWTANYFDIIYIMTAGGPLDSTHIFPTYIYELAFRRGKTGLAAAYGILSSVIILGFSLLYIRELNKRKALD